MSLLLAPAAAAVVECRFARSYDTIAGTKTESGSILIDPPRIRVRYDPPSEDEPRASDVRISNDGGASWIHLNLELKTYFRPGDEGEATVHLRHFYMPGMETTYSDVEARASVRRGSQVAGLPTREVIVELSFTREMDFGVETVSEEVASTWRQLFTEAWDVVPFVPLLGPLKTGLEPVDRRLAEALEEHPGAGTGLAVWSERVTRYSIPGETPVVHRVHHAVESCEPAEAPASAFAVPRGFRYQEPVVSFPGKVSKGQDDD